VSGSDSLAILNRFAFSTTIDPKAPTSRRPSSTLQHSANDSAIPPYKNYSASVSTSVDNSDGSLDEQDTDSNVSSFYQLSLTIALTTIQKHDTDTSPDQGDAAEYAEMCRITDEQNRLLAVEVLAFDEFRQDLRRVGNSGQWFTKARSDLDKFHNHFRELRASACRSGRESVFSDIVRARQSEFFTTPFYQQISNMVGEYYTALKRMSAVARPSATLAVNN